MKGCNVNCEPYCVASTHMEIFGMGQGPDVVAGLISVCEVTMGSIVYFDNLFVPIFSQKFSKMNL